MNEENKPAQAEKTTEQPEQKTSGTPSASQMPDAEASKKKRLFFGIIAVAIIAAGGIAYGVYAYATSTPDYLLSKSLEQLSRESAVAAKFNIAGNISGGNKTLDGDIAMRGEQGSKNGEAVIGIGASDSRVTASFRIIDDVVYMRFGSLANYGNLAKVFTGEDSPMYNSPDFKAMIARVEDKWFSLSKEEAAAFTQGVNKNASFMGGIKIEDIQKTSQIYGKHPFLKVNKSFGDEVIDNVTALHVSLKVDKPTYKAFLQELKAANLETVKVTDDDITNADKDADEVAKNNPIDMWIARDNTKLKKIMIGDKTEGQESVITLIFKTDLPQFGKIEKPSDAQPFSNFLPILLGQPAEPNASR